ncbi:hypothetical protein ACHAPA_008330 [Fusarium lateritium]
MSEGPITPQSQEPDFKGEEPETDTSVNRPATENIELQQKATTSEIGKSPKISQALLVLEDGLERLQKSGLEPPGSMNRRIELIRDLLADGSSTNSSGTKVGEASTKVGEASTKVGEASTKVEEAGEGMICQVRRLTMDEWKKGEIYPKDGSRYVINAYYRTPSVAGNDHGKGAMTGVSNRQERPERVTIPSNILRYELEMITDITLDDEELLM